MFGIDFAEGVEDELHKLTANIRSLILDTIDEQLRHDPQKATRNKKIIEGLKAPWSEKDPFWELRIGEYRVFYDVNEQEQRVVVRDTPKTAAQNDKGNPMKTISVNRVRLGDCIKQAQKEKIVLTQDGKPVALLVGVQGKDLEQIALGHSDELWSLIEKRRKQKTVSREELQRRLAQRDNSNTSGRRHRG